MLILGMKFEQSKSNIHIISRGLIAQGGDIVLCKTKGAGWFFLPGGHIEEGESARSALLRELEEETEFVNIKRGGHKNSNILPSSLKDGVLEWLENKKPFFKEI